MCGCVCSKKRKRLLVHANAKVANESSFPNRCSKWQIFPYTFNTVSNRKLIVSIFPLKALPFRQHHFALHCMHTVMPFSYWSDTDIHGQCQSLATFSTQHFSHMIVCMWARTIVCLYVYRRQKRSLILSNTRKSFSNILIAQQNGVAFPLSARQHNAYTTWLKSNWILPLLKNKNMRSDFSSYRAMFGIGSKYWIFRIHHKIYPR